MASSDSQSWSHSLILRGITLLLNIVCLVLLGIGISIGAFIHLIVVCDLPLLQKEKHLAN